VFCYAHTFCGVKRCVTLGIPLSRTYRSEDRSPSARGTPVRRRKYPAGRKELFSLRKKRTAGIRLSARQKAGSLYRLDPTPFPALKKDGIPKGRVHDAPPSAHLRIRLRRIPRCVVSRRTAERETESRSLLGNCQLKFFLERCMIDSSNLAAQPRKNIRHGRSAPFRRGERSLTADIGMAAASDCRRFFCADRPPRKA
jgi:hypothetical protein